MNKYMWLFPFRSGPFLAKLYASRIYGEAYWYLTAIPCQGVSLGWKSEVSADVILQVRERR